MKKSIFIMLAFVIQVFAFGQEPNFNVKPWEQQMFPLVIDPYQGNSIDFDKLITDARVGGIIHKASQGFRTDGKYIGRSQIAKAKGLLYASYHLGTNTDPVRQADFYLDVIKDNLNEPMALDIEDIGGNNISLAAAEKFIARIHEKTGKYPFVYVNNKVFKEINRKYDRNSIFAKCPLWYARFLSTLPALSTAVWDRVTLWQFSCEINCTKDGECLYNVPGTHHDIDVNAFNGSVLDLKTFWNSFH